LNGRPPRSLEIVHDHLDAKRFTLVDELQVLGVNLNIRPAPFALKLDVYLLVALIDNYLDDWLPSYRRESHDAWESVRDISSRWRSLHPAHWAWQDRSKR